MSTSETNSLVKSEPEKSDEQNKELVKTENKTENKLEDKSENKTENKDKQSTSPTFCQTLVSKLMTLFLIYVYTWSAEEVSLYIRQIDVGILADSLVGGERERFAVTLANQLSQKKTIKVFLFTCEKEKGEFPLNKNVNRIVVYDKKKKLLFSELNQILKKNEIQLIIYNDRQIDKINPLFQKRRYLVYINHNFYLDYLYLKEPHSYFKLLKKSSLVIDFVPGQIPLYKNAGLKNVLYMPKPIDYDIKKIKRSNLKGNNILLFGNGENINKDIHSFNLGIKAMVKIVEKVKDAKLKIISDFNNHLQGLKNLTKELKIENNVEFITKLESRETYYSDASILLIISETETSPSALLESKAFGIPSIISGKKYIDASKTGCLRVKEDNEEEIAKEAIKLLTKERYKRSKAKEALNSLYYFNNEHIVRTWVNNLWAIYNEENDILISKQEKKMIDSGEYKNNKIIEHEFKLLKGREAKFNCLNFNEIFDPIQGKALRNCQ